MTPLPTSDLLITPNDTNLVLFANIAIDIAAEVTWKHCIKASEYISNPQSQYFFLITSVNFNFPIFCSGRSGADVVQRDALQLLEIRGWRRRAENRDEWRRLMREAKPRKGL